MKSISIYFLFAFALSSCGEHPAVKPSPSAKTFVDDSNYPLTFESAPARIISVAPSLTEIVAVIGKTENLVGVSQWSDFPEEVKSLPIVGSYVRPDIETIVALNPDIVLVVKEGPPNDMIDKMRALGLKVAVLDSADFPGIIRNIRWLSEVMDCTSAGNEVASRLERQYSAVRNAVAGETKPRALYAIALNPVITVGRGSYLHDVIESAGAINIAGDINEPYPRMTLESIVEREPEIIFFSGGMGSEANARAMKEYWSQWPRIPAVGNGRLVEIDAGLINRPGPRLVEGLAQLASKFHPARRPEIERASGR